MKGGYDVNEPEEDVRVPDRSGFPRLRHVAGANDDLINENYTEIPSHVPVRKREDATPENIWNLS